MSVVSISISMTFSADHMEELTVVPEIPSYIGVDMDMYNLPADLEIAPTKENCKDLYIRIRQHLHQGWLHVTNVDMMVNG